MQAVAAVVSLAGILLAYLIFLRRPQVADQVVASSPTKAVHRFWFLGWGWDALYDTLFVRPYQWLARVNSRDPVDLVYVAIAWLARIANWTLSLSQTGNLRWYAGGIALGAIILVALAVFS